MKDSSIPYWEMKLKGEDLPFQFCTLLSSGFPGLYKWTPTFFLDLKR